MDAVDWFHQSISQDTYEFAVYEGGNSYSDELTATGDTVEIAISDVSTQSSVVTEGTEQNVSYRGTYVPIYDPTGSLKDVVTVGNELHRQNGQQKYVVRTKVGRPNEIDPELWYLGLDRANSSG